MKLIKQRVNIDSTGMIVLNVDSGLHNCEADIVLIIDESAKEKSYDFSDIAGKLTFEEDPLAFQKKLRNEWE